jgi:hypothetical protein
MSSPTTGPIWPPEAPAAGWECAVLDHPTLVGRVVAVVSPTGACASSARRGGRGRPSACARSHVHRPPARDDLATAVADFLSAREPTADPARAPQPGDHRCPGRGRQDGDAATTTVTRDRHASGDTPSDVHNGPPTSSGCAIPPSPAILSAFVIDGVLVRGDPPHVGHLCRRGRPALHRTSPLGRCRADASRVPGPPDEPCGGDERGTSGLWSSERHASATWLGGSPVSGT